MEFFGPAMARPEKRARLRRAGRTTCSFAQLHGRKAAELNAFPGMKRPGREVKSLLNAGARLVEEAALLACGAERSEPVRTVQARVGVHAALELELVGAEVVPGFRVLRLQPRPLLKAVERASDVAGRLVGERPSEER